MKKIVTVLALCLFPLTAMATDSVSWKDAQLAADQSLPHGLTLLPGSSIVEFPNLPQPSETHPQPTGNQQSFFVKVPSPSGHDSWWSDQYAEQLKNQGWSGVNIMQMQLLTRRVDQCSEQMIVLALGPNSHNSPMLKGSDIPEMDFDAVVFNYSTKGTCETK